MPEHLTPEVVDQTPDVTLAEVTDQDALLHIAKGVNKERGAEIWNVTRLVFKLPVIN